MRISPYTKVLQHIYYKTKGKVNKEYIIIAFLNYKWISFMYFQNKLKCPKLYLHIFYLSLLYTQFVSVVTEKKIWLLIDIMW